MEKTIREHFEGLPEPYRSQAIENMNPKAKDKIFQHSDDAINVGFSWEKSPQGYDYWFNVHSKLSSGDPLEPIQEEESEQTEAKNKVELYVQVVAPYKLSEETEILKIMAVLGVGAKEVFVCPFNQYKPSTPQPEGKVPKQSAEEMNQKDLEQLGLEIEHIFDSGANGLRVFEMVKRFIEKRYLAAKPDFWDEYEEKGKKRFAAATPSPSVEAGEQETDWEQVFETMAYSNKWLKELTEWERQGVIEMLETYAKDSAAPLQSLNQKLSTERDELQAQIEREYNSFKSIRESLESQLIAERKRREDLEAAVKDIADSMGMMSFSENNNWFDHYAKELEKALNP